MKNIEDQKGHIIKNILHIYVYGLPSQNIISNYGFYSIKIKELDWKIYIGAPKALL